VWVGHIHVSMQASKSSSKLAKEQKQIIYKTTTFKSFVCMVSTLFGHKLICHFPGLHKNYGENTHTRHAAFGFTLMGLLAPNLKASF